MPKFLVTKALKCTRFITYEIEADYGLDAIDLIRQDNGALDDTIVDIRTELDDDPLDDYTYTTA